MSNEIVAALADLGVTREALEAPLRAPTLEQGNQLLAALKAAAKKRYRELAFELHPDRTGGDEAKARRFALLATVMADLERLRLDTPPVRVVRVVWASVAHPTASTASTTTSWW